MKAMRFAVLAGAALFVAACLPVTTKNPVGTTTGFKQDPSIIGVWKAEPQKDEKDQTQGFLSFLNAAEPDSMTAVMLAPGKDVGDWGVYNLKAATLGPNHFLNAWAVTNNGKPAGKDEAATDVLLMYRMGKDGKLTLYLVDEDKARDAVKAGRIKGDVGQGSTGDVHITADPAALDKFFASKEGAALFVKPLVVMDRVK
ncbi:MAG TPA: hypothetical protein VMF58_09900 [Rhizomicrobium sp.]|nr:hypothetical protein [Rhizomicrobium sp.]